GPALLLLDEPFSGLDRALRRRIHPALLRIQDETGVPTLLVTHDAAELLLLADEVLVLERGRLEAAGRARDIVAAGGHAARALAVHVLTGSVTARGESLLR